MMHAEKEGNEPMKKWTPYTIIDGNNEQPGIIWTRTGIAQLGEPRQVARIEYYETKEERDDMIFNSPNFAR